MTNSERIRKALQKLCWEEKNSSQSAFAQKVGLNQSYISGIISGKKTRRLPLETMEKLFPDLIVLPLGLNESCTPLEKEIIQAVEHLNERDKIKALALLAANFPYAVSLPQKKKESLPHNEQEEL